MLKKFINDIYKTHELRFRYRFIFYSATNDRTNSIANSLDICIYIM